MRFLSKPQHIDFMGKRTPALIFSAILIIGSLVTIGVRGLHFGIDFTGGTVIEMGYPKAVDLGEVRSVLAKAGLKQVVVQHLGTAKDVLIRIAPRKGETSAQLSTNVLEALSGAAKAHLDMRRVDFVGPQVGSELAEKGGLAMLFAIVGILIYVALRFEWKFAVGSILAVLHDPIITIGVFAALGVEFDLTVLAAVLAVIGYSLNDTIVVFDRIRETFRKQRKGTPEEIMNVSINDTLSRTIMTSLTTMLTVVALYVFGGPVIHGFALALIIGIVVGTYSSIYIASTAALMLGLSRADLLPAQKEGAGADGRP